MALPQKVIEQLGREPQSTPGWAGHVLMFSGTIFFLSLVIYFGLAFGYSNYLNTTLKTLQDQTQAFAQQVSVADQKNIVDFYSQVSNLKIILAAHVFSSQLFAWLEKNSQINVTYSSFNLNASNSQLILGGDAKTMDDLNQQLAIFGSQPEVGKVILGSMNFSNGAWHFEVTLRFVPGYFNPAVIAPASLGAASSSVEGASVTTTP